MYPLHRRFGFVVPLVLVALVPPPAISGDSSALARCPAATSSSAGWSSTRSASPGTTPYALKDTAGPTVGDGRTGWLLAHRLPLGRPAAVPLLLVGLGALLLLTVVGPYPVSMITVPGERLDNTSPPSLALLALATLQLGVILLLHNPVERWLRRSRPWRAVIGVNAVVLTVFLWHLSAVVLLIGALNTVHWLPLPTGWHRKLVGITGALAAYVDRHPAGADHRLRPDRGTHRPDLASGPRTDGHRPVRHPHCTHRGRLRVCGGRPAGQQHGPDVRTRAAGAAPGALVGYLIGRASCGYSDQHGRIPVDLPGEEIGAAAARAPLRCGIGGRVEPVSGPRSDRLGEFGKRRGDPRGGRGVDGEFVVSAAEVLHERVSGDDHLCCLVRS